MKFLFSIFILLSASLHAAQLTEQEQVVAITILAEARGEGQDGMGAVAAVISQRSAEKNKTAKNICLEKYQFSCWNNKKINQLTYLLKLPQAELAIYLAKNIDNIDRSKVGYANHYYASYIKPPYWAKGKTPVSKIGKHLFFKL